MVRQLEFHKKIIKDFRQDEESFWFNTGENLLTPHIHKQVRFQMWSLSGQL